jgi:hypothetical protein
MEPAAFYAETNARINSAQAGVTLFTIPDASAAVEAAMLAHSQKPQLVVAENAGDVPRLVRGLPLVARVLAYNETADLQGAVRDFLEQNLYGGAVAVAAM